MDNGGRRSGIDRRRFSYNGHALRDDLAKTAGVAKTEEQIWKGEKV